MRTVIEERHGVLVLRSVPLSLVEQKPNTTPSWVKKAKKRRERSERASRFTGALLVRGWPWALAFVVMSVWGFILGGVLRHVW